MPRKKKVAVPTVKQKVVKAGFKISKQLATDISKDALSLSKLLSASPELKQQIIEICTLQFKDKIDSKTFTNWEESLVLLLGEGPEHLIRYVSRFALRHGYVFFDTIKNIPNVKTVLPFLQEIAAKYGALIRESYILSEEDLDTSRRINWKKYYSQAQKKWFIDFAITKYSGEKFVLTEEPNGLLWLANGMLAVIASIPAPIHITSKSLAKCKQAITKIEKIFIEESKAEKAKERR